MKPQQEWTQTQEFQNRQRNQKVKSEQEGAENRCLCRVTDKCGQLEQQVEKIHGMWNRGRSGGHMEAGWYEAAGGKQMNQQTDV